MPASEAALSFDLLTTTASHNNTSSSTNDAPSSRSVSVLLNEFRSNGTETPCAALDINFGRMANNSGESSLVSSLGTTSSCSLTSSLLIGGGRHSAAAICKPQPVMAPQSFQMNESALNNANGCYESSLLASRNDNCNFNAFMDSAQVTNLKIVTTR